MGNIDLTKIILALIALAAVGLVIKININVEVNHYAEGLQSLHQTAEEEPEDGQRQEERAQHQAPAGKVGRP